MGIGSDILYDMKYKYPILFGLVVFIFGVFVSSSLGWYFLFPGIDKVFHFLGGVAVGWFFLIYFSLPVWSMPKFKKVLIAVGCTCLVAVCWEYAERLSALYSPQYAPWLYHWFQGGDLNDTLLDVLAGMGGSFVFAYVRLI